MIPGDAALADAAEKEGGVARCAAAWIVGDIGNDHRTFRGLHRKLHRHLQGCVDGEEDGRGFLPQREQRLAVMARGGVCAIHVAIRNCQHLHADIGDIAPGKAMRQ
jgi:hypothetical protein